MGNNVLWRLHTSGQTAEGFHMGADVKMLSMYPQEEEVLFPPNSAMQVRVGCAETCEEEVQVPCAGYEMGMSKRRFLMLDAVPSFI